MRAVFQSSPRRKTSAPDDAGVRAQLGATRNLIDDLNHLRTWNHDFRHRLWRAHIRAEINFSAVAELDAVIAEIADYHAAVALLCNGRAG